jgi:hypothetical protein
MLFLTFKVLPFGPKIWPKNKEDKEKYKKKRNVPYQDVRPLDNWVARCHRDQQQ